MTFVPAYMTSVPTYTTLVPYNCITVVINWTLTSVGLSLHTFHGNFFVRSTDLLSLPSVNPDLGYTINISIDDNLKEMGTVCFQAALLYTSSRGQLRVNCYRASTEREL